MPFVQSRLIDIPNLTTIKTPKQRSSSDDSYIISICEKKSKEIGISILNLKLPIIQLCQFCDVQTYVYTLTELFIYQPTEVCFLYKIMKNIIFLILLTFRSFYHQHQQNLNLNYSLDLNSLQLILFMLRRNIFQILVDHHF